jgi:RNA polymerase sigma-70 factor (ECF subfamily)
VTGEWVSALIARAEAQQTETGFSQRVAENQRRVFQIAYSVLGNPADAEDVAQEAFLRAFQKFSSLRDAEKFRAWVNRISFRLALNRQRGYRRRLVRDTTWHTTESRAYVDGTKDAEQKLLLDRIRAEIEQLPEKIREALILSLVEGMEAADVGEILGIPAGTVRSRIHAGRKLLLEVMK